MGKMLAMGILLCLVSAAAFGAMAIFGKLAYDAGVNVATLLSVRFTLAAVVFAALTFGLRGVRPRRLPRRTLLIALALGAIGYATQAGLFFGALRRLDASLLTLLLYTYPAWVVMGAVLTGIERPSRARLVALLTASAGLVLALGGAPAGGIDALGAAMGIGAALAYSTYILVADRALASIAAVPLAALAMAGAAASVGAVAIGSGQLDFGFAGEGWVWIGAITVVSTVIAIGTFFAGLARVGPPTAAILSTVEPVVTLALAFAIFGERLRPAQLAGAALVLGAALVAARAAAAAGDPPVAPADAPAPARA